MNRRGKLYTNLRKFLDEHCEQGSSFIQYYQYDKPVTVWDLARDQVLDKAKADFPEKILFVLQVASEGKISLTLTPEQCEQVADWFIKWFGETKQQ